MQTLKIELAGDYMPVTDRTVDVLKRGGTAVFPTDTLYGLGCNALDPHAVGRVFDIKHRSYVKALPMLVRDLSWARELAYIDAAAERIIERFWPGKVTFVLPRRPIVPAIMAGGGSTVGMRAPDHAFVQTLLRHLGYPLAGTSANLAGPRLYRDAKSLLQEEAQERLSVTPTYQVMEEWGPDHARQFRIGVYLGKELAGEGQGQSKQDAQQAAAEDALKNKDWK